MYKYKFRFTDYDLNPAYHIHESEKKMTKKECKELANEWAKGKGIQNCIFTEQINE